MRGGLLCCPLNLHSGARLILRRRPCPIPSILVHFDHPTSNDPPSRCRSKPSPNPRSIRCVPLRRFRSVYSRQFTVDYRAIDARGSGGMGDLCPDPLSDCTRACWLSNRRPSGYAFAASRPFGGSVQPQAHHPLCRRSLARLCRWPLLWFPGNIFPFPKSRRCVRAIAPWRQLPRYSSAIIQCFISMTRQSR